MFELGTIDDLVLPAEHSTTGRALASMSKRRTFEKYKTLDPASAQAGGGRDAIVALRAAFAARLPGNPHAIADALAEPSIGPLARRALVDPSFLVPAITRWLDTLEGRRVRHGVETPIEGKIRLYEGDAELARCLDLDASGDAPDPLAAREALAILRRTSPATRVDVERFAIALVPTARSASSRFAIGVGTLPPTSDVASLVRGFVGAVILGKLDALVEGRVHDDGARVALATLATDEATHRILETAAALKLVDSAPAKHAGNELPVVDPADPLAFVVAELRTLRASGEAGA